MSRLVIVYILWAITIAMRITPTISIVLPTLFLNFIVNNDNEFYT